MKGVELRSCSRAVLAGAGQGAVRRRPRATEAEAQEPFALGLEPAFSARVWSPGPPGCCGLQPSLRWARGVFGVRSWFRGQGGLGA